MKGREGGRSCESVALLLLRCVRVGGSRPMAAAQVGPIGCLSALLSLLMLDRARVESPGFRRLVLSLPYVVLCQTLVSLIPQDQIVLRLILAGQYAWWSTFKVIAFVCNRGPLLEIPTSRPVFFVVLLLPVSPLRRHGASAV